jgi:hypothetical protein
MGLSLCRQRDIDILKFSFLPRLGPICGAAASAEVGWEAQQRVGGEHTCDCLVTALCELERGHA